MINTTNLEDKAVRKKEMITVNLALTKSKKLVNLYVSMEVVEQVSTALNQTTLTYLKFKTNISDTFYSYRRVLLKVFSKSTDKNIHTTTRKEVVIFPNGI